jgi:hypothetical protein
VTGTSLGDERATLTEFLPRSASHLANEVRGPGRAQLACRSVEPSTMSPLGLARHLAEVERKWIRSRFAAHDVPDAARA